MQNNLALEMTNLSTFLPTPVIREAERASESSQNSVSFSATLDTVTKEETPSIPIPNTKITELREWLSTTFNDDPDWADRAAFLYGCEYIEAPLLCINEWPVVRIAATGELYTPEKAIYFKQLADLYREGRVQIYQNEIAKGTSPLHIIDKIFDYNRSMPEEFQKMSGWL